MSGDDDYDASKHPLFDLVSHVAHKGWQGGSWLGLTVVAPLTAAFTGKNDLESFLRTTAATACVGTGVAGVMGLVKVSSIDKDGLVDRAYRLHYNEGMRRVDRFCDTGAMLGAAAAGIWLGPTLSNIVGGAAVGTATGLTVHLVTRDKETANKPNQMIQEAIH